MTAVITLSLTTISRTCVRVPPTARSRPSSRVRSWIVRNSELAMPNTEITRLIASSAYSSVTSWLSWSSNVSRYSAFDSTRAAG